MKKIFLLAFVLPYWVMAQTTLPTSWSFVSPSPSGSTTGSTSNPPITYTDKPGWSTKLDVSVTGTTPFVYATGSDGTAACRLDGEGEYVQIWFAEKPGTLSYSIRGTAISPNPPFQGSFKIQCSVDGTTWTDIREYTSMPGSFPKDRDSVSVPSTARYVRFYYATKVTGSNVALDNITLAKPAAGNAAAIEVKTGSRTLANGVTYVNGKTASTPFTIQNLGLVSPLTISSISITGEEAGDYTVSNAPTSVAAGGAETFTLNYAPASLGSSKATMTINSNDADNGSFVINLYGISGNFATEPTAQPTDLSFNNVKAFTFNVAFKNPSQKPEGYIVLRKKGAPITESPVDGNNYKRGDYIGNSQVAYIGTDTGFRPAYITANTTYYFKVFAFNGPAGFENYLTANPLSGSTNSAAGNPGSYYSGINSTTSNFVGELSAKIAPHDTVFYGNYTATLINNFYTRDTIGGKKVVNCVYTDIPYVYDEPFLWWGNTSSGTLTREHTFAQSWMPTRSTPTWPNGANGREFQEYNDLHHLFPADQLAGNGVRSNYPLGEVVTVTSQNGLGKFGKDASGKTVYEPKDSHKGDAARAMFYMCIAYNGIGGNNWSLGAITAAQQNDSILKKWHFQDLPDAHEIARHEYVASVQKNRNPFIDSVNFVCRINFNNLTWIANPIGCGVVNPMSLTILSPLGGETWKSNDGRNDTVKWNSSGVDVVIIQLLKNDTAVEKFAEVLATTNFYVVPDSLLTPFNEGQVYKIKLTASNFKPLVSTSPAVFSIERSTGVGELLSSSALSVYPNPSNGLVSVDISKLTTGSANLVIMDITGRVILEKNMQTSTHINLTQQGIYFVKLQTENGSVVKKLIIE
jgi:hypothetical protein